MPKQNAKRVVFRLTNELTFQDLSFALAMFPKTKEKDWLIADSQTEYKRFCFLLECQAQGEISQLHFHPEFTLLESTAMLTNLFRPKKSRQRAMTYTADAAYFYRGIYVVEDVKGLNRASGKAWVQDTAILRHKLLRIKLQEMYGAFAYFKIVVSPTAPLDES